MNPAPPRIEPLTPETQLASTVATILSLPQLPQRVQAFGLFPGMGEISRDKLAIRLFRGFSGTHLLLAGENRADKPGYLRTPEKLVESPWYIPSDRMHEVRTQVHTENTKTQADWMIEQVHDLGITSLGLVVSGWHMPRAYLTLLAALLRSKRKEVAILPLIAPTSFGTIVPSAQDTATNLLAGELGRIPKYQESGDVATFNQLQMYLGWLWEQPILHSI